MKIINVRGMKPNAPGVIYCGRRTHNGWCQSVLHNPFIQGKDSTREEIIAKYRDYLRQRIKAGDAAILAALDALTPDSVLGCWCKPEACHCDVIVEVWKERNEGLGR